MAMSAREVQNLATTVVAIQGHPVSANAPAAGDALMWNGSEWVPTVPPAATGFLPLTGGTLSGPGNLTVNGVLLSPAMTQFGTDSQFFMAQQGNNRLLNWAGAVYDAYLPGSGTRVWVFANNEQMSLDGNGNLNANANVGGSTLTVAGGLQWSNNNGWMFANASVMCAAIAVGNDPSVSWSFTGGYMATAPSVMANAFVQSSDRSRKINIEDLGECLPLIKSLAPKRFEYNTEYTDNTEHWGFVAQDVQGVIPSAVKEVGGLLGLEDVAITAALVAAVQELAARVEELEAR